MIKLFTEEEYLKAKPKDLLPLKCKGCGKTFYRTKRKIQHLVSEIKRGKKGSGSYCNTNCNRIGREPQLVNCKQCGKKFYKTKREIERSPNHFCSRSCAASYNNTHKTTGTRRSKLEKYLEEQLTDLYDFKMNFNSKKEINSELDIFIPHLNLAFELNGIFHYEAIYGEEKLSQIQNNDDRKFQACLEHNIELCIIDTSSQKRFTIKSSQKFLEIIKNIIDSKINL